MLGMRAMRCLGPGLPIAGTSLNKARTFNFRFAMADIEQLLTSTRDSVRGHLHQIYPDFVEFQDGFFTVQEGSAIVSITIRPWHDEDVVIEFTSQLVSGGNITAEVMKWLLQKNVELHFGGFGLLFDDTVVYSHTLPGINLTRESFEATIRTVATIADHYDDEVATMAGGVLARDMAAQLSKEIEQAG